MQRGVKVLEFSLTASHNRDIDMPDNRLVAGDITMDTWIREEDGNVLWQNKDTRISKE